MFVCMYVCIFCDAIEKTSKAKQLCRFRVSAFFLRFVSFVSWFCFVFIIIITTSLTPLKLFLMGSLILTRALSLSLFLLFRRFHTPPAASLSMPNTNTVRIVFQVCKAVKPALTKMLLCVYKCRLIVFFFHSLKKIKIFSILQLIS